MRAVKSYSPPLGKIDQTDYARHMDRDLSERLLTHYVGGAWRAPLGAQMVDALDQQSRWVGRVVIAGDADLHRALQLSCPMPADATARLTTLLQSDPEALLPWVTPDQILQPCDMKLDTTFPVIVRDARPIAALRQAMATGAIYLPNPELALFGIALALVVQRAELPPGSFAMLPTYR